MPEKKEKWLSLWCESLAMEDYGCDGYEEAEWEAEVEEVTGMESGEFLRFMEENTEYRNGWVWKS